MKWKITTRIAPQFFYTFIHNANDSIVPNIQFIVFVYYLINILKVIYLINFIRTYIACNSLGQFESEILLILLREKFFILVYIDKILRPQLVPNYSFFNIPKVCMCGHSFPTLAYHSHYLCIKR